MTIIIVSCHTKYLYSYTQWIQRKFLWVFNTRTTRIIKLISPQFLIGISQMCNMVRFWKFQRFFRKKYEYSLLKREISYFSYPNFSDTRSRILVSNFCGNTRFKGKYLRFTILSIYLHHFSTRMNFSSFVQEKIERCGSTSSLKLHPVKLVRGKFEIIIDVPMSSYKYRASIDRRSSAVETRGAGYYRFNLKTRSPFERDSLLNSLLSVACLLERRINTYRGRIMKPRGAEDEKILARREESNGCSGNKRETSNAQAPREDIWGSLHEIESEWLKSGRISLLFIYFLPMLALCSTCN